jgi:hypothetical protein
MPWTRVCRWSSSSHPYRATSSALLNIWTWSRNREPPHTFITVLLTEVLPTGWWHPLVHNCFAWQLKRLLLFRAGTAVTGVPCVAQD